MKPIGPLMWEHRLIEQIVPLLEAQARAIEVEACADPAFVETAVDFFRTYADRTHHGKEEDILFRALESRSLSPDHARIMAELADEHRVARAAVSALVEAREAYLDGAEGALQSIAAHLVRLATLYPSHIAKEDRSFFFPVMSYFSEAEQADMLRRFYDFDRHMIHERYEGLLEGLGARVRKRPGPVCVP